MTTTNVDRFEVVRDPETGDVVLKLMDVFGYGDAFGFKQADAVKVRDALTAVIARGWKP